MKFSPTLPRTEALRAMLDAYGEGMLVLWKARILYVQS